MTVKNETQEPVTEIKKTHGGATAELNKLETLMIKPVTTPANPILTVHEFAVLTAALIGPSPSKGALGNTAATVLADPHFEKTVQLATIDRLEISGFLQGTTVTTAGKESMRKTFAVCEKLLNVLNATSALR